MTIRLCLFASVFCAAAPLRAQDEPIHMRPELPLIFPFAQNGKDVTVKFPVMVNQSTVIQPGTQLRVLYVLSHDAQTATDLLLAHADNQNQAYARDPSASLGTPQMPSGVAHEIEGYRRTVWEVPNNFILAMAQYPTESMHLIYSPSGKTHDLHDAIFGFFDGLFVGSPSGKVTVIAVEKESRTDEAGIKAGDEIEAVGAYPTRNDLMAFANGYATAKKDSRDGDVEAYAMTLRGTDGAMRTVKIAMPQSIKGGLMSGFSEKP